jgi:hypothetical protein
MKKNSSTAKQKDFIFKSFGARREYSTTIRDTMYMASMESTWNWTRERPFNRDRGTWGRGSFVWAHDTEAPAGGTAVQGRGPDPGVDFMSQFRTKSLQNF